MMYDVPFFLFTRLSGITFTNSSYIVLTNTLFLHTYPIFLSFSSSHSMTNIIIDVVFPCCLERTNVMNLYFGSCARFIIDSCDLVSLILNVTSIQSEVDYNLIVTAVVNLYGLCRRLLLDAEYPRHAVKYGLCIVNVVVLHGFLEQALVP